MVETIVRGTGVFAGIAYDSRRNCIYVVAILPNAEIYSIDLRPRWPSATGGGGDNRVLEELSGGRRLETLLPFVTIAGCGKRKFATDEVYGTNACFNNPVDVVLSDTMNVLYVSDAFASYIRTIDLVSDGTAQYLVHTFAGDGDWTAEVKVGNAPSLPVPTCMAFDYSRRELIVCLDASAAAVRLDKKGSATYVTAQLDKAKDGTGLAARFGLIGGMAFDADDNLYIADQGAHAIRKISPRGVVTTPTGRLDASGVANRIYAATAASFDAPTGLAVNTLTGVVYISDTGNFQLRAYDPRSQTVSIYAGSGDPEYTDGPALTEAAFTWPGQLAFFHDPVYGATVYVLDCRNAKYIPDFPERDFGVHKAGDAFRRVRNGTVDSPADRTVDDNGLLFSFFKTASSVVVDSRNGVVYFSDYWNKRIVRWTEADGATLFWRKEAWTGIPSYGPADTRVWPGGLVFDIGQGMSMGANTSVPGPSLLMASPLTWGTNYSMITRISVPATSATRPVSLDFPFLCVLSVRTSKQRTHMRANHLLVRTHTYLSRGRSWYDGSFDGIMTIDDKDTEGTAFIRPYFLALDSHGLLFAVHRWHGKIMRIGALSGQACNVSLPAASPAHPCGPGTSIDWSTASCVGCPDGSKVDTFPYSSFCYDGKDYSTDGKSLPAPSQGTTAQAGLVTAVGVISFCFVAAAAAFLVLRRRRELDALKRRPSSGEAVDALVSTINLSRRESARGGLSLQAARAAEESGSSAGSGVSMLSFADLVPDTSIAPLFGGFGVVFAARWVSRGLRVAVKVPKDLVVSGYLPPAAAAELVKEAQVRVASVLVAPASA